MNQVPYKVIVCFTLMVILLIVALSTRDEITGKLFASFGIITGAIIYHHLSIFKNEQL